VLAPGPAIDLTDRASFGPSGLIWIKTVQDLLGPLARRPRRRPGTCHN